MSKCDQCGDCCRNIILPLAGHFDEDDIRWIEYHDLKVTEKDGKQFVEINHPCSKLENNKCSIYENRPEICQIFVCQKLQ